MKSQAREPSEQGSVQPQMTGFESHRQVAASPYTDDSNFQASSASRSHYHPYGRPSKGPTATSTRLGSPDMPSSSLKPQSYPHSSVRSDTRSRSDDGHSPSSYGQLSKGEQHFESAEEDPLRDESRHSYPDPRSFADAGSR